MGKKNHGQASLELILLVGGAVLVAAVTIGIVVTSGQGAGEQSVAGAEQLSECQQYTLPNECMDTPGCTAIRASTRQVYAIGATIDPNDFACVPGEPASGTGGSGNGGGGGAGGDTFSVDAQSATGGDPAINVSANAPAGTTIIGVDRRFAAMTSDIEGSSWVPLGRTDPQFSDDQVAPGNQYQYQYNYTGGGGGGVVVSPVVTIAAVGVCENDAACDDGDPCTQDTCDAAGTQNSSCLHSNQPDGTPCGSGRSCQAGVCTDSALPAKNPLFGVTDWIGRGNVFDYPDARIAPSLDRMEQAAVSVIRTEFQWFWVETTGPNDAYFGPLNPHLGAYDYDFAVDSATDRGFDLLVTLHGSAAWASSHPDAAQYRNPDGTSNGTSFGSPTVPAFKGLPVHNSPPHDYDDDYQTLEDYAYKVADHFKGRVKYWEIWNEPNHYHFLKDYRDGRPNHEVYFKMLKAAYTGIKRADPDAVVVMGGLSTNGLTGAGADNPQYLETNFLPSLLAINDGEALDYFDVWNIHPYAWGLNNDQRGHIDAVKARLDEFADYRENLINQYGARADKPVWLGELGVSAYWVRQPCYDTQPLSTCQGGLSADQAEQYKADMLRRYYTELPNEYPFIERIVWYELHVTGGGSGQNDAEERGFYLVKWPGDTEPLVTPAYCQMAYTATGGTVATDCEAYADTLE